MTKVLYVFGGEKASGAEIVIERLMSYNQNNVEPHLFISPGKFANELISAGKLYPITTISRLRKLNRSTTSTFTFFIEALKNYFIVSSEIIKYVRKNKITYIHANTVVPASYLILAIICSKFFARKRVWIWSDHDLKYFSKIDILFSKACATLYDITLVVSDAVKEKYSNKKPVKVLYNGLDLNVFKPNGEKRERFRQRFDFDENQLVLTIAGTISPRKGQLMLIRVFKNLTEKFININLIIAGSFGEDDNTYNDQVTEAIKSYSNIFYLGQVTNMLEVYCGSDIIINNSSAEGGEPLGTTIYEAMACEKIVIASDTGGTPEIITDKEDGFIFKADDEESLEEALRFVMLNLYTLSTTVKKARKKVDAKFSIQKMIDTYNYLMTQSINSK
jgi:glycosyltransferase involved in cell wall biosynthesis